MTDEPKSLGALLFELPAVRSGRLIAAGGHCRTLTRRTPVSSGICRRLIQAMVNPSGLPPARAALTTCSLGRRGSRSGTVKLGLPARYAGLR
jgi:hypothetical protein